MIFEFNSGNKPVPLPVIDGTVLRCRTDLKYNACSVEIALY